MDDTIPRSITCILLILSSAFFASSETALSYCGRNRMKKRAEDGDIRAKRIIKTLNNFDKTLSTILVGANISCVFASSISAVLFIRLFGAPGVAISTAIMTVLIFLFSDTIPKSIARANPDKLALLYSFPISVFTLLFTPITALLTGIGRVLKLLLPKKSVPSITEDEFQTIIENIEEEGLLEPEESKLIKSAISFSDTKCSEIMTPLDKLVAVEIGSSQEQIKRILIEEKYSRIPVYAGTPERIVGILHTRELLRSMRNSSNFNLSSLMKLPYFITPDSTLDATFEGLGRRRTHMAVITGEDGAALGIVTMEDILEELVGEIYDEDDADAISEPSNGEVL